MSKSKMFFSLVVVALSGAFVWLVGCQTTGGPGGPGPYGPYNVEEGPERSESPAEAQRELIDEDIDSRSEVLERQTW